MNARPAVPFNNPTNDVMRKHMKNSRLPLSRAVGSRVGVIFLLSLGLSTLLFSASRADETAEVIAVSAKASYDYVRTKLPDGTFAPEYCTFGNGGRWSAPMRDLDFEQMKFDDVVKVVARPMKKQGYVSGLDPKEISLLVMVYWGTTDGSGGSGQEVATGNLAGGQANLNGARQNEGSVPDKNGNHIMPKGMTWGSNWGTVKGSLFGANLNQDVLVARLQEQDAESEFDAVMAANDVVNRQRDRMLVQNAMLLGYDSELTATNRLAYTAAQIRRQDIVDELEDNRYFVVLMAYDFPLLMKEKKAKLLWETRYSVRQRGIDFSKSLAAITEQASRYFGQDTHGLLRKPLPEGRVTLGKLEVGPVVPDK